MAFLKVHTINIRNESRKTHFVSTLTSCSKTLIVISLLSVKYHIIKSDPNKNIGTDSQLSVCFTFLFVKSKIYKAKNYLPC